MSEILFQYERVNPTSWAYLSSLLTLALFFKFGRPLCLRNLDLLLIVLLAPGLLCIEQGLRGQASDLVARVGYVWLLSVNALLLVRTLLDSSMVRRPLLEPNLTPGGLTFLAVSLLAFLTANIVTGRPGQTDLYAVQRAEHLSHREASELEGNTLATHGPGFTFLFLLPHISTRALTAEVPVAAAGEGPAPIVQADNPANVLTARTVAVLCQGLIVAGILLIARRHFDQSTLGLAAATLYLLLPYTALWSGNVTHTLPAALLVGAVLAYRRPMLSGALIGLGCGAIYYPFALLPLWVAFYWRRGLMRFSVGVALTLSLVVASLVFTSSDASMFVAHLQQMLGLRLPTMERLSGVWAFWNGWYRVPILVAFFGLSFGFAFWPAQKNLGTLISGSAALMLGVQFWHAHSGGLALAWYLPLLLLMVFRPNLEDRVATAVVASSRWDTPPA
ncbi:hypothetical protein [Botrimarina hoheduenensis]|uniref:DUF2029 domain-containing protein n=1 Tax=Botrimarina hoheduenensis TaxID=2528000 RepID=A0A5C5W747_9BACT|nr:hypothetical protein [Botrimarina hoheduenensis]TWT46510.1 hypothetical protein Pla111_16060 [Botrimarina hoheduenensis]